MRNFLQYFEDLYVSLALHIGFTRAKYNRYITPRGNNLSISVNLLKFSERGLQY